MRLRKGNARGGEDEEKGDSINREWGRGERVIERGDKMGARTHERREGKTLQ